MVRVIFDRSAFHHGERFNLLATSQLRALCHNRKLSVAHAPIFLEETLRMYGNQKRREQLRQQLPFILAICNGGIYQDERTIWKRELALNHGPRAHIFVSKGNQKRYVQSIRIGILQDDWNMWRPSLWDDMEEKKQKQHDAFKYIRAEVPERLRQIGDRTPLNTLSFNMYLESIIEGRSNFDLFGCTLIQRYIKAKNNKILQERWEHNKEYYPFLTGFIKGFAFALYYAAIAQNMRLDRNAQVDYALMTYLTHADILVSADTGFLQNAFFELWKPHGKKLLTPEEFVTFINTL